MQEQLALLPELLTSHLQLAFIALLIGTAISVPLGILATRVAWLEQPVMGVVGVIQTIPSLALLAIMVPVFVAFGLSSIGFGPAIVALTLYSMLPILGNTVAGIAGVDRKLIEAAQGVGMTKRQQLLRVELPTALPVIVAGLRTSTVWVVGTATLSTPVGAPSLGNFIFSGLQIRNLDAVLIGCFGAAGLAIVLDTVVKVLERGLRRRSRVQTVGSMTVLLCLVGFTGVTLAMDVADSHRDTVKVGAKTFAEQYILAEAIAEKVKRDTGVDSEVVSSLGSLVVFDALAAGDIDVYVDYTGTIWANVMKRVDVPSRDVVEKEVGEYVFEKHGVTMLGSLGFENAYCLAIRGSTAKERGIERVSELSAPSRSMVIGGDYEFFARPEWKALSKEYALAFREERPMDSSLMYQAIDQGSVDVIAAYTTDGRIGALDLRVLEDEKQVIPPYDAILLVSKSLLERQPEVVESIRGLIGTIDNERMGKLNFEVVGQEKTPASVAHAFVDSLK